MATRLPACSPTSEATPTSPPSTKAISASPTCIPPGRCTATTAGLSCTSTPSCPNPAAIACSCNSRPTARSAPPRSPCPPADRGRRGAGRPGCRRGGEGAVQGGLRTAGLGADLAVALALPAQQPGVFDLVGGLRRAAAAQPLMSPRPPGLPPPPPPQPGRPSLTRSKTTAASARQPSATDNSKPGTAQ